MNNKNKLKSFQIQRYNTPIGLQEKMKIKRIRGKIKKAENLLDFLLSGDPPGVRTQDPILKRDVLYLLS